MTKTRTRWAGANYALVLMLMSIAFVWQAMSPAHAGDAGRNEIQLAQVGQGNEARRDRKRLTPEERQKRRANRERRTGEGKRNANKRTEQLKPRETRPTPRQAQPRQAQPRRSGEAERARRQSERRQNREARQQRQEQRQEQRRAERQRRENATRKKQQERRAEQQQRRRAQEARDSRRRGEERRTEQRRRNGENDRGQRARDARDRNARDRDRRDRADRPRRKPGTRPAIVDNQWLEEQRRRRAERRDRRDSRRAQRERRERRAERRANRRERRIVRRTENSILRQRQIRNRKGELRYARSRRHLLNDRRYRNRYRNGRSIYFLPPAAAAIAAGAYYLSSKDASYDDYVETFMAPPVRNFDRRYSLAEVVTDPEIRSGVRSVDLNIIQFRSGSDQIPDGQLGKLENLADAMLATLSKRPKEVFLLEGHTDAVGSDEANLELSERRAATVLEVLIAEYGVPAENLEAVGYGEQYLRIDTEGNERRNRRVVVRAVGALLADNNR